MNKSTFFTGQPIFSQLLKFVPKEVVILIAKQHQADRYSKRFSTYEHLVTMLYSIFNNCNSLREVATGMLASEQRLPAIEIIHKYLLKCSNKNDLHSNPIFYRTVIVAK
jgi:hypothetical protein